jgi:hypothetical protein
MSRTIGRRCTAALASVGLLVGATAITSPPAGSVPPAGDCTEVFPLGDVTAGQPVNGLTVDSGITPEPFTGEVIGILDDGIGMGVDMIIAELDSPAIQAAQGIWQGMSGSPVYAADGRLIGAVAYGLSAGPSPIAGITPIEEMDDYLASTARRPARVEIGPRMARRIAQHSEVSGRDAAQGARQLPMPLGVSGVSPRRLAAAKQRPYMTKDSYAVGRASAAAAAAGPESIEAGGNIAATLSHGDVTAGGVGTATTVCDGRVVAFGHPMLFSGPSTMTMHPATAVYVQPDSLGSPFKVANIAAPAGTITDDRLTGITGTFEELPDALTLSSKVTMGGRSRVGTTEVTVAQAAAEMTFYQLVGNHDRVVDGTTGGTETQTWTVSGTDADGTPFRLTRSDRITSRGDITYDASAGLADLVYAISEVPDVTLDEVTADGVVTPSTATYRVSYVQQLRGGAWVTLNRKTPGLVKAGGTLRLRVVLVGPGGRQVVRSDFKVPRRAKGLRGSVSLTGGASSSSEGADDEFEEMMFGEEPEVSLADLLADVRGALRNDQVGAYLGLAGRGIELERTRALGPVDRVVKGQRRVRVFVR